ncbi:MAG: PDZ domain-containing protein [Verrucomicrobiales bacterium]|nr:PDZ domain-containing protein [Verrucomicrobiales bacterium]
MRNPSFFQSAIALVLATVATARSDDSSRELMIHWSDSVQTHAVSTPEKNWYIGVAPSAIETNAGAETRLSTGDHAVSAKILHLDPSSRLCLLEASDTIEEVEPIEFAKAPIPCAGSKLHCSKRGSSCPTAIAGREYSIRGEPLSSPLLRVRVSDAEKFCEPGTPIVCENGKLFGILIETDSSVEGEAHAIPVCCIRKMVTEMERYGHTGKVWIGLVFEDESNTPQVVEVRPDSPAREAMIKPDDVILTISHRDVTNLDDLTQAMHTLIAGDEIEVTVLRGISQKTLTLTPRFAEAPE